MCHSMTVGTQRHQIGSRIDDIARDNLRNRGDMVDMNEPLSNCAVGLLEVESAGEATASLYFDTGRAVGVIPLIAVYKYPNTASLGKSLRIQIGQLFDFLQRNKEKARDP